MKKFLIIILSIAMLFTFVACSGDDSNSSAGITDVTSNGVIYKSSTKPTELSSAPDDFTESLAQVSSKTPVVSSGIEEKEDTLPDELPLTFIFSSGAGGWGTSMTLNDDGSFEGLYSDSEMGEMGETYPQGTVYVSEFSGKFGDIKQINDYTYSMTLKEITSKYAEGEEWILEEIRYVVAEPYGVESGKEFILYTPQTPVEGLSEEFLSWWPNRYLYVEGELTTLSCYGIYNKETEYGFFTY